jgi:hypothetical protein
LESVKVVYSNIDFAIDFALIFANPNCTSAANWVVLGSHQVNSSAPECDAKNYKLRIKREEAA